MPLNASRIDSEKLPSGNLIYLGTASANVKEEDAFYSFPIYREGDLSEEASVTIHCPAFVLLAARFRIGKSPLELRNI